MYKSFHNELPNIVPVKCITNIQGTISEMLN